MACAYLRQIIKLFFLLELVTDHILKVVGKHGTVEEPM